MALKENEMILHNYYLSSASWRVRAALYMKGISYTTNDVDLLGGQQHTSKFLSEINPMHQLPALTVGTQNGKNECITQSLAIIDYIQEKYPKPSVYPSDSILKAKAKSIADTISAGIQPLQNLETLLKVNEPLDRPPLSFEEKQKFASYWITRKFDNLEILVKSTAGLYCVGDEITIADISLVPQMFNARRFKVDTSKYPTLKAIDDRLQKLDMFYYTHPYISCSNLKMNPDIERWLQENKRKDG